MKRSTMEGGENGWKENGDGCRGNEGKREWTIALRVGLEVSEAISLKILFGKPP